MSQLPNKGAQDRDARRMGDGGNNADSLPSKLSVDVLDQLSDGYYEMDREFRYTRINFTGA